MTEKLAEHGRLYVVGTPMGHLEDITLRALRILGEVDLIAAEDTRHTGRLLARHGIENRLISCYEHNEQFRISDILSQLAAGRSVALVVNAGTPAISDPGYRIVKAAAERGFKVVPVPGPCGVSAAVSVSGIPSDRFLFLGFLPRKTGKRKRRLKALEDESATLIFYESPRRLISFLSEAREIFGDRQAVLCREMTKIHEEIFRAPLAEMTETLGARKQVRGECIVLVAGKTKAAEAEGPTDAIRASLADALARSDAPVSAVAKKIAKRYGLPKRTVYDLAVRLKDG